MFERAHHRCIAQVLDALDGARLRGLGCLFGGGTAISMRCGEYRESVDMDFLVSDADRYRELRSLLSGAGDIGALQVPGVPCIALARDIRIDQYGIRTVLRVDQTHIKFEIVREARIELEAPGRADVVCGVATLSVTDLATSKLLANADRWRDDSVFARDVIDLAMMDLPPRTLKPAVEKAVAAYGETVVLDVKRALDALRGRPGHLSRCMAVMGMTLPPALLQQRFRALQRRLERIAIRE